MFYVRQEISVFLCDAYSVGVHKVKCVLLVFSPLVKYMYPKGALSYTAQYYKGTSFGPFFGSSSNLYTRTHKRNYKNLSINLRERDLFLYSDVQNFVKNAYD